MDYSSSSRLQSHSVDEPSLEMPVLQPQSVVLRPSLSARRKLPTPPPFSRLDKEEAVRRAVEMLRERSTARKYLAGAVDSDSGRSDLSVVALQNLFSVTTPVASGYKGNGAAASVVTNGARTWGRMDCPGEADVKPVQMSTPFQSSHVVDVHDRIFRVSDSSSSDDDQPSGKHLLAAKTPFKTPSNVKKHSTVHHNKNVSPDCHEAREIEQLRGQFDQYGQVVQSLSNRLDDVIDSVVVNTPQHTTVKQPENEPTDRLVAQMKNKKSRKVK